MRQTIQYAAWCLIALCSNSLAAALHSPEEAVGALARPADMVKVPEKSFLQAAATAGDRLVAVGERGIIILSDDSGQHWRQVPVPVSTGLTAVKFVNSKLGWAVGHGAVVLSTQDAGEHWVKQFDGTIAADLLLKQATASGDAEAIASATRAVSEGADKPLLDLHFFDEMHGIVIGAYNLAFSTNDGGRTWQAIQQLLDNPKDLHLYALSVRGSDVLVVGEQGLVRRSIDGGKHFERVTVPYSGSFFLAAQPTDNEIVVAGLRGNVWRSTDAGVTWKRIELPTQSSLTAMADRGNGNLWLADQAGSVFTVRAGDWTSAASRMPPLNGISPLTDARALGLSAIGIVQVTAEALPVPSPKRQGVTP